MVWISAKKIAKICPFLLAIASVAPISGQSAPAENEPLPPPLVAASPATIIATQGYATDGTLHYLISGSEIVAYDKDWKIQWDNKAPFDGMPPGVSHVGDSDVYDGRIYSPVETYKSCEDYTQQRLAIYSAKDGSFEKYYDLSQYAHEVSSVTVVPSTHSLYITSFCESGKVFQYDLDTMKPMAPLVLSHPITKIQGISWSEKRKQFAITSDSPAQKLGYVWSVSPQGKVSLLYTVPQTGELEGVDYTQDQIRYVSKQVWFLSPEVGKNPSTSDAWAFDFPTTGLILASQLKGLDKLSNDLAQLERYRNENASLPAVKPGEKRIVFYGDSITDIWGRSKDNSVFFPGKGYINRGISGQTTAQMLIRFRQDVIDLHPSVVVMLAGTNDIAGNIGPASLKMIADNFRSMADLAKANGIRMVICSVLPADHYSWRKDIEPAEPIRQMNLWLKKFAAERHFVYVDYYSALANTSGGMKDGSSLDGVHPTAEGYAVMTPLAEAGIAQSLHRKP